MIVTLFEKPIIELELINEKIVELHALNNEYVANRLKRIKGIDLYSSKVGIAYVLVFNKDTKELDLVDITGDVNYTSECIQYGNSKSEFFIEVNNFLYTLEEEKTVVDSFSVVSINNDLMNFDVTTREENYPLGLVVDHKNFKVSIVPLSEYKVEMGHLIVTELESSINIGRGNRELSSKFETFLRWGTDRLQPLSEEVFKVINDVAFNNLIKYQGTETIYLCLSEENFKNLVDFKLNRISQSQYRELSPNSLDDYSMYGWLGVDVPWSEMLESIENIEFRRFVEKYTKEVEVDENIHKYPFFKISLSKSDRKFHIKKADNDSYYNLHNKEEVIKQLEVIYKDNKASKYRKLKETPTNSEVVITYYHKGDTSVNSEKTISVKSQEGLNMLVEYLEKDEPCEIEGLGKFILTHKDFKRAFHEMYSKIGWYFILKDNEVIPYINKNLDECIDLIYDDLIDLELFDHDLVWDDYAQILKFEVQ